MKKMCICVFIGFVSTFLCFGWTPMAESQQFRGSEIEDPRPSVSGSSAREALADILDTYERIVKTYSRDLSPTLLRQIEQARGALF